MAGCAHINYQGWTSFRLGRERGEVRVIVAVAVVVGGTLSCVRGFFSTFALTRSLTFSVSPFRPAFRLLVPVLLAVVTLCIGTSL